MYKKNKIEFEITPEQATKNHFTAAVEYLNQRENTYIICKKGKDDYRLEVYEIGSSAPKFVSLAKTMEEAVTGWYEVIAI